MHWEGLYLYLFALSCPFRCVIGRYHGQFIFVLRRMHHDQRLPARRRQLIGPTNSPIFGRKVIDFFSFPFLGRYLSERSAPPRRLETHNQASFPRSSASICRIVGEDAGQGRDDHACGNWLVSIGGDGNFKCHSYVFDVVEVARMVWSQEGGRKPVSSGSGDTWQDRRGGDRFSAPRGLRNVYTLV